MGKNNMVVSKTKRLTVVRAHQRACIESEWFLKAQHMNRLIVFGIAQKSICGRIIDAEPHRMSSVGSAIVKNPRRIGFMLT
jgi:hypothetical protein